MTCVSFELPDFSSTISSSLCVSGKIIIIKHTVENILIENYPISLFLSSVTVGKELKQKCDIILE